MSYIHLLLLSKADCVPGSLEAGEPDLVPGPEFVDPDLGPGFTVARPALGVPARRLVQPVVVADGELLKRLNVPQSHDAHDVTKPRIKIR